MFLSCKFSIVSFRLFQIVCDIQCGQKRHSGTATLIESIESAEHRTCGIEILKHFAFFLHIEIGISGNSECLITLLVEELRVAPFGTVCRKINIESEHRLHNFV